MARLTTEEKEDWRAELIVAQRNHDLLVAEARAVYYGLIAKAYDDGLSHLDISMALKMSPTTVRKALDEAQVRPRKRLVPRQ